MEPWETLALTQYFLKTSHPEHLKAFINEKGQYKAKYLTQNSIRHKFGKKTSIPKPVECLEYIKCYSSTSPRPIENPGNSIRYKYQKICSWLRRPKTILEIRKNATFLQAMNKPITTFLKALLITSKFSVVCFPPAFLNTGITNETFQQSGKQDSFRYILKSSNSMYESPGSLFF